LRAPGGDGVTLWVDDGYRYLMIFTGDAPPVVNLRNVAVEPMTCPPNDFRTASDVIRLEPGESCTGALGRATNAVDLST
jgi:aldose 1-epimerase